MFFPSLTAKVVFILQINMLRFCEFHSQETGTKDRSYPIHLNGVLMTAKAGCDHLNVNAISQGEKKHKHPS